MLVEHTFVTTLEQKEALQRAARFLQNLGFRLDSQADDSIQAKRGRKQPSSRKLRRLPQLVRVGFDRGRVTVAASIKARAKKEMPVHAELMRALATGLQRLLADALAPEEAAGPFRTLEARTPNVWLARDVLSILLWMVLVLVVVGAILACTMVAMIE